MKIKNLIYDGRVDLQDLLASAGFEDSPSLLIQVFASTRETGLLLHIRETVARVFPSAVLVGATCAGEILDGRVQERGVLFSLCRFEGATLRVAAGECQDSFSLGAQLGARFRQPPPRALVSFACALEVDGGAYLRGIESQCPGVLVAGGLAGDLLQHEPGHVFTRDFLSSRGAVVLGLYGEDLQVLNRYSLDWVPLGKELRITRAEGNRVYTIEDIPAADLYGRYLGRESTELLPVLGVHFPLIKCYQGISVAHACVSKNGDGSLDFMGEMETGAYVRFGIGDSSTLLASAARHCQELADWRPEGIFVYSCLARKLLMQSLADREVSHLHAVAPVAGFYTSGEFYSLASGSRFFNYTLTLLALREGRGRGSPKPAPKVEIQVNPVFKALTHLVNVTARELETLAGTDLLTGLCNRRSMQDQLYKILEGCRRYAHPLALIMFDVDHFKRINDCHGHHMGDLALREVARVTQREIRRTDVLGRWGGEEFLLLCPETDRNGALELAERIRCGVERATSEPLQHTTVSLGVTVYRPGDTVDDLLRRVDEALYLSKKAGRNLVSCT